MELSAPRPSAGEGKACFLISQREEAGVRRRPPQANGAGGRAPLYFNSPFSPFPRDVTIDITLLHHSHPPSDPTAWTWEQPQEARAIQI